MRELQILFACLFLLALGAMSPAASMVQAADTGHAAAGAHGDDAHHASYSFWSDLPFWSFIAFLGFLFAIKKLGLWSLLVRSMAEREKAESEAINIAEGDLSVAQLALREAKGRIEALDGNIREIFDEAKRDVTSTKNDILEVAQKESKATLQRAQAEIERVRDQALNEIFSSLADKVAVQTEKRLRTGLSAQDHSRLVDDALTQFAVR
ncbi:F0F1 ATP synthase subunit B family protein [Planctomicrobium sp. SH527]|uniref:F0F1 ATP synthase subunit B family protein n=1 Tax=Planctomicrobium sp. SH527 TaxID=3448123 RepID=UPI003F5B3B1C